ncbi:MAG: hypothetical protein H6865_03995 [Rhodospirillales bacterium]|nr:hypothetical protein [Alphaproteobacteria bacterium]MCB9986779.1 hypothetical protein [Rhodospirillales bacterium]USO08452.1 MAG: hypothetical protein H6866_04380 [Rhodospirillales bacterium]
MPWPPPGWPMFSCIVHDGGKAYYPARPGAPAPENDFLCYQVETRAPDQYTIEIMAGSVGTHGLRLNPVIGIRLSARPDGAEWFDDTAGDAIIDMHVRGQRLIPERAAILRVILATTFLISRIDRGIAPNLRRILRLYRLEK